ncbi:MAG: DUF2721 domain-containing protein [Pseudomonadales bacterium]|nr:DUF2721 domain-containing protein [Pseudomonadales bacterium]
MAPVFLLAGIAGMLNVLSVRLGRVVDRARIVETHLVSEQHENHKATLQSEIEGLWKRVRLVNWSLRMFVCAALLVCLVIVTLFLGELQGLDLSIVIATLFIGAMAFMITGLVLFLFEVGVSTSRIRAGIVEILEEEPPN